MAKGLTGIRHTRGRLCEWTIMDKDIKLAKIKKEQAENEAILATLKDIFSNPVVEVLAAIIALEQLQRHKYLSKPEAVIIQTGVLGVITVQQLAPSIPALSQSAGNVIGSLGKLIPALGV